MKIGFVSRYDPDDRRTWSGTSYYTLQQLKRLGTVDHFHYPMPKLLQEWLTTQKSINRRWFGKHSSVEYLRSYARHFSRQLSRDLRNRPVDLLFVSASPQLIAYADTDIPVIYMSDATFQQLQGYYPGFSNLATYNIRQGIELDRLAYEKATHCMLASEWNKHSAVIDYGIAPEKISVVPCGANLDPLPSPAKKPVPRPGSCRLLFLGVEWERKGGAIALETFRLLRRSGVEASLHIIGCVPPTDLSGETGVSVTPFLDKSDPDQRERLDRIFQETDLLLLPTRAECAGIVFCEAAAYGVPSIATATGGVTDYVRNGINGYALSAAAGASDYTERIRALLSDPSGFERLQVSSRDLFETTLSWDAWGRKFAQIAARCVSPET